MSKKIFFLVLFLLVMTVSPLGAQPQISGKSAVLLDLKSGQVLYDYRKDEQLPPASTTKILTAIMAIESGQLDQVVTIGANPPLVEGTRIYLVEGEKITLKELVLAALVHSANDAALAIAEHLAGSKEEFAKLMNMKAVEIGAINSNFLNPHGLSEEGHYTTAYDLAIIARYAMKNETFRQMVQQKVLDWEGQEWQTRLVNINKLLWRYEGADGIKTGYTSEAKSTIVASATRDKRTYLAVVLGSSGAAIWTDAEQLLDYGFRSFQGLELANTQKTAATIAINEDTKLQLVPKESFSISLPQDEDKKVESKIVLEPLQKRITKGQIVGKMVFIIDGLEVGRIDLLAKNTVTKPFKILHFFIYLGAILFFLQVLWRIYLNYQRKQRRQRNLFQKKAYYRGY